MILSAPIVTAGFGVTAFTVFALGLRHGADPDHLAAIDNLTRNSAGLGRRLSRFVGTLFAGGHSIMVLSIAALAGLVGQHLAAHGAALETAGTWVSIVVLFLIGAFNVRQLLAGKSGTLVGPKTAMLPKSLRLATSPLAAIPIGLLFGLGFDTSSQVAAYALALAGGGVVAALVIGLPFSLGMAVTDTLDSLLVYHLCMRRPLEMARATRTWIIAVTVFAFVVGGYELAQVLGWRSPVPDLVVSALIVLALLAVFAWTLLRIKAEPASEGKAMNRKSTRLAGGAIALIAVAVAVLLYAAHPVRGSDHQDSPAMINRPGADITDVFVFPSPANANNVVLAVNVHPLIPQGQGPSTFFDPAVMYQFKIDNVGDHKEHLVIQFQASGSGTAQSINVYGPAAPNQQGTVSTFVAKTGTVPYNQATTLPNGMQIFAGPREDPFFFDLSRFFQIIPDRNSQNQPNPPPPDPSLGFRGFTAAFNSAHGTSCDTSASQDFLSANHFNVLSLVVELPKTMLAPQGGQPGKISVWTTSSTTSGS